ncbi:MAG: hypothetical protein N2517_08590 [Ignavibacteria bacterium]|nr:hypothetical protein [Ignavibacteria bacterium]
MKLRQGFDNQELLKTKVEGLLLSINELSRNLNGDIYNFASVLRECVQELPNIIENSIKFERKINRMKQIAIAKESLLQCKNYLSMMKRMKMVSTSDLISQVEEINKLLENQS